MQQDERLTTQIWTRIAVSERQVVEKAARARGITLCAFVREAAVGCAHRQLAGALAATPFDRTAMELSDAENDG